MKSPSAPSATALVEIAIILVAVVLAMTLWGLHSLPEATVSDQGGAGNATRWGLRRFPGAVVVAQGVSDTATAAAISRWQGLWERLEPHDVVLPEPERLLTSITEPTLRPAGDTAFMRYRNLWASVHPTVRHQFRVVAISSDPHQKLALLKAPAQDHEPQVRFRALLEMARVHLRSRAFGEAESTAHTALAIPGIETRITADAYFIIGFAAFERQELQRAEQALAQATSRDPGFWDARWAHLAVLSRQLDQPHQRAADCLDRTHWLIEHLSALPLLAQDRTQFRDIADTFARSAVRSNPAFALVTGLGYLWSGDRVRARTALEAARHARGILPRQCEALIVERSAALLARLPN